MKYKVDVVYKGIAVQAILPVTVLGAADEKQTDTELNVNIPGDVQLHIEGELRPIETFIYFRFINKIMSLVK
jgi:hypothetical protein